MDWEVFARVTVAVLTVVSALAGLAQRPDPLRRQMAADAKVLTSLPVRSPAHASLLAVLSRAAATLEARQSFTRAKSALAGAIIGSLTFGYGTIWLALHGTWWGWLLAAASGFVWLVFIAGVFDSATLRDQEAHKREREARTAAKARGKTPSADQT